MERLIVLYCQNCLTECGWGGAGHPIKRGICDACGLAADCYYTTTKFAIPEHIERGKSLRQRIADLRKRVLEIEADLRNSREGLENCPQSAAIFQNQIKCCETVLNELQPRLSALENELRDNPAIRD
jgi:hypothetical protein